MLFCLIETNHDKENIMPVFSTPAIILGVCAVLLQFAVIILTWSVQFNRQLTKPLNISTVAACLIWLIYGVAIGNPFIAIPQLLAIPLIYSTINTKPTTV